MQVKSLLEDALRNEKFKQIYEYGLNKGLIQPFSKEMFERMKWIQTPFDNSLI